jgi:RND family efflux transporter MFP subunit
MSLMKQALFCVLLVVAAAGGWYAWQHIEAAGHARETAEGNGAERGQGGGNRIPGLQSGGAINVITAPVEVDPGGESVMALGTARAARSITLYPEVTGMVAEVLFTPGEPVEAGAPMIRLADDAEQVAVDRARVTLDQARSTLERSRTLAESKTISTVALSDAEAAVALAEIELRSAGIDLERRVIKAPFAGVTGLTDISIGDYVTSSTAIATLDDLSTLRVRFELPERWMSGVTLGQSISATAQGLPGSAFSGRIAAIDNRVDEATRTLRVEAELVNWGSILKTGMAVRVTLDFATDEELMVSSLSVQWDRRGSFVWKIVDGAARRAEVAIIRRESGVAIVNGDLAAGDLVVVEGTQRLREGAKVAEVGETPVIIEEEAEEAAPAENPPAVSGGEPARTPS